MKHRRKPQKRNSHANPLDRNKAYEIYITPNEDGTLKSVKDVAESLGYNDTYLQKVANQEKWSERRVEIGKLALRQIEITAIENQGKINSQLYAVWQMMLAYAQAELLKQLSSKKLGARSYRDLAEGLKNTTDKLRVLSGQVTDISKSNLDATIKGDDLLPEDIKQFNRFLGLKDESNTVPTQPNTN